MGPPRVLAFRSQRFEVMRRTFAIGILTAAIGCDVCPPRDRAEAATGRTIAEVAEVASKGVVTISASRRVAFDPRDYRFERDLLFRFFFGVPDEPRETIEQSTGSAVIVSDDGLALTNHHLVEAAEQLRVTTASGEELKCEIVGVDPETDLALLRLQGNLQDLVPLPFGDSSGLRAGEIVVAIGSAFGFGQTVTAGIVSGKGRSDLGLLPYEDFIQTDAAINPGNSGGALVNLRGELVGISTALLTKSGAFEGIGLAVPSNLARDVMRSITQQGRVVRAYLGASVQEVDERLARALHLESNTGALVSDVVRGSPAERAGLQPKDLISAIDGEPVASTRRFRVMIAEKLPEKAVVLEIRRDGRTRLVKAVLIERPTRPLPAIPRAQLFTSAGIEGWRLDAEGREMLWVPDSFATGLVVADVRAGSPAWQAGLRAGDVIVALGDEAVESTEALDRRYREGREPILLRAVRRGTAVFLVLDVMKSSMSTPDS
jgi:Do/DeqQ family serine protease